MGLTAIVFIGLLSYAVLILATSVICLRGDKKRLIARINRECDANDQLRRDLRLATGGVVEPFVRPMGCIEAEGKDAA